MSINRQLLAGNKIEYSFESGQNLFQDLTMTLKRGDKIGLVGKNGVGKSTLLRILGGELNPGSGVVHSKGLVYYLPQLNDEHTCDCVVYEYISLKQENWWEVMYILKSRFDLKLNENQKVSSLSGGEMTKINLAIGLSLKPEVLLLDEPTNHLDLDSMGTLEKLLDDFEGGFIVVSHDENFLASVVEEIWELESGSLSVFGGGYSFYKNEKEKLLDSALREEEVKRKELIRIKKAKQKANEKAQKAMGKINRLAKQSGRKIAKQRTKVMRERSEKFHNKKFQPLKKVAADRKNAYLKSRVRKKKNVKLGLINGKTEDNLFIRIKDGELKANDTKVLIQDIEFDVYQKNKIAILGANGSGKTALVKSLYSKSPEIELSGDVYSAPNINMEYVDQKYDIVSKRKSLVDNVLEADSNLVYQDVRKCLSDMGFVDEVEILKRSAYLSGGELARLAFAIISIRQIDVLILDEPTNNLDIQTKDAITDSIKSFGGALLVVSHDLEFLRRIGVEKVLLISNKRLVEVDSSIEDTVVFKHEIIDKL